LKKLAIPGLVLYTLSSGLGLFLHPGPADQSHLPGWIAWLSDWLPILWLVGYVFLAFILSYTSLFSRNRFTYFPFIVLGIILLNYCVQVTGGVHSPLWPAYFVFAVLIAAFQQPWRTLAATGLILAIEASNLFFSRQWSGDRWPVYTGFALSLAIVPALISYIIHRTRREAKQVQDEHERLIKHADAINPLSDADSVEALSVESRLASNIKAAMSREDAFGGLLDMIYEFVPAHAYALFLKEQRGDVDAFVLRARRSDAGTHFFSPIGSVLRPEDDPGIISGCALHNQPQYLSNSEQNTRTLGYYNRSMPVRSILAIPIVQHDVNIGVLVVDSLEGGAFSLETQDMLSRFTPFFIQIIEKIRVSQDLAIRATTFAAMHKMSAVLNSSLEIDDILGRLSKELNVVVPYDLCVIVQYDDKTRTIAIVHQSGDVAFAVPAHSLVESIAATITSFGSNPAPAPDNRHFPLLEGTLINRMLDQWAQGQPVPYHFSDLSDRTVLGLLDTTTALNRPIQSLSCWPLATGEKFIGAFFIGSITATAFSEYHRYFLDTLMNQVALVMDNTVLHKQIKNMAHTDGLTGLLNHRTFMEKLDEEFKRLDRAEYQHFSLLLFDIDFFKKVNDEHGHPVGDVALKSVAGVIRQMTRSIDFVARYGGEEFAIGMVGANTEDARIMAERIRKTVENTVITAGTITLKKTVSIGVASFYPGCEKKETLISQADQALYHAKHTGRNRVCLYPEIKDGAANPAAPGH